MAECTVSITLSSDETTEGKSGELAGVNAVLIQMSDVDLDSRVILGCDEPVCGGALPRDVEILELSLFVLHLVGGGEITLGFVDGS